MEKDLENREELGIEITRVCVVHFRDRKKVKLYDLVFRSTGERWHAEPLWSVPPVSGGLLVDYERQRFAVVLQERLGVDGRKILEAVAGEVEEGEDPLVTFVREAEEEAGLRPDPTTVRRVAFLVAGAGRTDEVKTLWIAPDFVEGVRTEEEIETVWFSFSELNGLIEQLEDGGDQTLWGLLLWFYRDIARNRPELFEVIR